MLRQNVFARAERAHLQHAAGNFKRRKIGWALLACNLIFAALPFLATDHYADIPFHTLVGLCLIGFCLGYELHIIILAIGTIEHEKQNRTWDSLVLTGVHGNRVIVGKWWAVMRSVLGTVFLLSFNKLALAFSVMQYLNIYPTWIDESMTELTRPFIYMSYTNYAAITPIRYYPQFWQIAMAFIVLVMLTLAEVGLLAAIGMAVAFVRVKWLPVKMLVVYILRIVICGLGLILSLNIGNWEIEAHRTHYYLDNQTVVYRGCDGKNMRDDYRAWCVVEHDHRRVFETAQVAVSAITDTGVLLASNILRPIATLLFALRNGLSALIAIVAMLGLTLLNLFIAGRFVQSFIV